MSLSLTRERSLKAAGVGAACQWKVSPNGLTVLYLSLLHHLETKLSTPLVPHIPTYAKHELSGSHSSMSVSKALRVRVFVSSDSSQHQCHVRSLAASPFSPLSLGNKWPFSIQIDIHERIPGKEEKRVPQVFCLTVVALSVRLDHHAILIKMTSFLRTASLRTNLHHHHPP